MQLDTEQLLSQEYERFIEFGTLLDRTTRKYLVEYLKRKISNEAIPSLENMDDLKDTYFQYFRKSLDELFGIDGLLEVVQHNQKNAAANSYGYAILAEKIL